MKKTFCSALLLAALFATAPFAVAQTAPALKSGSVKTARPAAKAAAPQLLLQNGRIVSIKDAGAIPLERELTLNNGTKLQPDGTLVLKDGKKEKLREGESVSMDGKITTVGDTDQALLASQNSLAAIEEQFDLVMADSELQKDQLTLLSERLTVLNEKMLLLNEKVNLLQKADSKKARKAAATEIQRIQQQTARLDARLKELEK